MREIIRTGILFLAIQAILISGVYGVSISGGTAVSAESEILAKGSFSASNDGALSEASSLGIVSNFDEAHWVEDVTGKHAEVWLYVKNGEITNYNTQLKPNKDKTIIPKTGSVSAYEQVTVVNAEEIHTQSNARNGESDVALSSARVIDSQGKGSLIGYSGSAYANANSASSSQKIDSISGEWIWVGSSWASNIGPSDTHLIDARGNAWITNGIISGYSNSAKATKQSAEFSQTAKYISGDKIWIGSSSANTEPIIKTLITDARTSTEVYNGVLNGFSNSAKVTSTIIATSDQNAKLTSGSSAAIYGWSNNKEGYNLQFQISTDNSIGSYSSSAKSTQKDGSGSQAAKSILGAIYIQECALDQNGKSAGTFWRDTGSISNYKGSSKSEKNLKKGSASADKVSGSMNLFTNAYVDYRDPTTSHASVSTAIANGYVNKYQNEAKSATGDAVSGSEGFAFASGEIIKVNPLAEYIDKIEANENIAISSGSLDGYSDTAKVAPTQVEATQNIKKAESINFINIYQKYGETDSYTYALGEKSESIVAQGSISGLFGYCGNLRKAILYQKIESAKANQGQFTISSDWGWGSTYSICSMSTTAAGKILSKNYESSLIPATGGPTLLQKFGSIAADNITMQGSSSINGNNYISKSYLEIDKGSASNLYGSATSDIGKNSDETWLSMKATGSSIDVKSIADQDSNAAGHDAAGKAEFGVLSKGRLDISVKSKASPDYTANNEAKSGVTIDKVLPNGLLTAIILEPRSDLVKLSTTPSDLKSKGYAYEWYKNTAASLDQFKKLDDYNIAIVNSHMNPSEIGLSGDDYITADWLAKYYKQPPRKSFVILAGCSSFHNYPSPLATKITKANLRGGYNESVNNGWNIYLIDSIFNLMANNGMTAGQANSTASSEENMTKYKEEHPDVSKDIIPLYLDGNKDFKL